MDAAALTPQTTPSWNPLRCDETTLPPGWLLAAKLLAFAILRAQRFLGAGPPFLPFVPLLDSPLFAAWLAPATEGPIVKPGRKRRGRLIFGDDTGRPR